MKPDARALERMKEFQRNEITEYHIYRSIAGRVKQEGNRQALLAVADDEKKHYETWRAYTGTDVRPDRLKVLWYTLLARVLGYTFALKIMEQGEDDAQDAYADFSREVEDADAIADDEDRHEEALIEMLDEDLLKYVGSIVLGISDALVELTGALAGLTLALQNGRLIALTGGITGIAAALSMGASEYLSTKSEETEDGDRHPLRAAFYTTVAYGTTVALLIMPYLLVSNYFLSLGWTLLHAVLIIAAFTFYISVTKSDSFTHRFAEMCGLSLGVAGLSFLIGFLVRHVIGVDV